MLLHLDTDSRQLDNWAGILQAPLLLLPEVTAFLALLLNQWLGIARIFAGGLAGSKRA